MHETNSSKSEAARVRVRVRGEQRDCGSCMTTAQFRGLFPGVVIRQRGGMKKADFQGISMISGNTKSIPVLSRGLAWLLWTVKNGRIKWKVLEVRGVICSRRDRWSNWHSSWDNNWVIKEKTVQVARRRNALALDFHTEGHTSAPPRAPLVGPVDAGIASLSSKSLLLHD